MKLHEDKDFFLTAVSSAAQSLNLPDVYIEKDYWVTHLLNCATIHIQPHQRNGCGD